MDFNIENKWVFEIGGVEIWITETIFNTWIIMLALIIFSIIVRIKLQKFEEVPRGFQNFIELIVEAFNGLLRSSAGDNLMYIGNWFFMAFTFILVSNLSGLVGLRPPTADWATAFAFAFATLVLIQIVAIKNRGIAYLKSFFEPNPVFFPLNLIGELARPISLSFRLYGNVLAGLILVSLLYTLAPIYVRFVIPAAIHVYFDLFSGVLQTYIFCVLSMTFIGASSVNEEV